MRLYGQSYTLGVVLFGDKQQRTQVQRRALEKLYPAQAYDCAATYQWDGAEVADELPFAPASSLEPEMDFNPFEIDPFYEQMKLDM